MKAGRPEAAAAPAVPPVPGGGEQPAAAGSARQASRLNKVKISTYVSPEARRQLREVALAENTTVEEILRELINGHFQQRKRPRLA